MKELLEKIGRFYFSLPRAITYQVNVILMSVLDYFVLSLENEFLDFQDFVFKFLKYQIFSLLIVVLKTIKSNIK